MSKTKYLNKLIGKGKWFKLRTPDEYSGAKRWTFDFYPNSESIDKLVESGIKLQATDPETKQSKIPLNFMKEGMYIRPRRDLVKRIKGEDVTFEAPEVLDQNGDPAELQFKNNGSTVALDLAVFGEGTYVGHRLQKVQIVELVEELPPEKTESGEDKPTGTDTVKKPKMPF